jgi:hypothetical protein
VGIGGGGDVVGALGTAELARSLGTEAALGGTTWERRVVDPLPGPRSLDELTGIERLHGAAALASADTRGPGGFELAEGRAAGVLGEPVALIDPNAGPAGAATGIAVAAEHLRCDLVAFVDVGGDVLAHGDEPGLASPLCDAVLLAAATLLPPGLPAVGAVFGPGCDGELTPAEVLERVGELAAAGGLLGDWTLTAPAVERLEALARHIPTEASAQALRCARGERGEATIRGGRRTVPLSPLGAVTFYFEPAAALASAARLARAVAGCDSLESANDRLHELGVRSELDLERDAARA